MRRNFTLLIAFLSSLGLFAQQNIPQVPRAAMQPVPNTRVNLMGFEEAPDPGTPQNVQTREIDVTIGITTYDLQSNGSTRKQISVRPDGTIAGVWTYGVDDAGGFPERGTAYNVRRNFAWGDIPEARIESVRTGWGNHVFLGNGGEFTVSHSGASQLATTRRSILDAPRTESTVTTAAAPGLLWPRVAVGGTDGMTVHVIAITTPVANGGAAYNGVDGQILYFRSPDGGLSWDRTDVVLDGLGADFSTSGGADAYYIDARGTDVVIGVFSDFADVLMFKSSDNGDTWTKYVVNDFPLENYVTDQGYTYEQLPPFDEASGQPDSLAMQTSDNSGTVIIDNNGLAHMFYGNMWIQDDVLDDGNTSFYPATNGIVYWNEGMEENSPVIITGVPDINGNDTLDIASTDNIASYFFSLSSMPTAGVDANGNIYLTFSGVVEGEVSQDDDMQHYRHLYIVVSEDGGETWSDPVDIISEEYSNLPVDLLGAVEAVFPSMARDVDGNIRLVYQQDFRPGLHIRGDMDDAESNNINYSQIPVSDLISSVDEPVAPETFGLVLAPNVTKDQTFATFQLEEATDVQFTLLNIHGQVLKTWNAANYPAGEHRVELALGNIAQGLYFVRMHTGATYSTVQVIKQ